MRVPVKKIAVWLSWAVGVLALLASLFLFEVSPYLSGVGLIFSSAYMALCTIFTLCAMRYRREGKGAPPKRGSGPAFEE